MTTLEIILAATVALLLLWILLRSERHDERNASRPSTLETIRAYAAHEEPRAPINFWTLNEKLDTLLGGQEAMSKEMDDLKTAVEAKVKALTDENTALKADAADHAADKQKAAELAAELAK